MCTTRSPTKSSAAGSGTTWVRQGHRHRLDGNLEGAWGPFYCRLKVPATKLGGL